MQRKDRNLDFPELLNVRDLGGCPTRSGAETRWRSLLRADNLDRLTIDGVQVLLAYGVRTIIDLRWPMEAATAPSYFQQNPGVVNYVHISLLGTSVDAWRTTRPPITKVTTNCVMLDMMQAPIRSVMQTIAMAPQGGILFHCVSGKDRTGLIAALLLALVDVEPEAIAEDYALSTGNLQDANLAMHPDAQAATLERVDCPPEHIFNTLAHLESAYNGVHGYMSTIGVASKNVERLQRRLLLRDGS